MKPTTVAVAVVGVAAAAGVAYYLATRNKVPGAGTAPAPAPAAPSPGELALHNPQPPAQQQVNVGQLLNGLGTVFSQGQALFGQLFPVRR